MPAKPVALALSSHPGPAVAVTIITVGLGFGVGLPPGRLVLLGFAMLAGQVSMGLSNDWIDADRDRAVGREDKPISRGWIEVGTVRSAALVSAAASVLLSLPLGWPATIALVFTIGLGWAYNAGLKKTVWSIAPYVLSFGSLPAVATLALPEPATPSLWALGVGGLLGGAAHFANTLPDLDDDRATGVSGLPHRLGRRVSTILTYVALLLAAGLELSGTGGFGFVPADIGLVFNIAIASTGIAAARRATRWHFRLIIFGALVDVAVLIFAGARLLA